jgi:hypothetical protein
VTTDDRSSRSRPRRPRRAVRPGTRRDADESPDVVDGPREEPGGDGERERWLRDQRPPHWE